MRAVLVRGGRAVLPGPSVRLRRTGAPAGAAPVPRLLPAVRPGRVLPPPGAAPRRLPLGRQVDLPVPDLRMPCK